MSHPKGPLTLEFDGDGALIEGVIRVPNVYQEWREDAYLLTAAPELLAACEQVIKLIACHQVYDKDARTILEQAIARAKGEEVI